MKTLDLVAPIVLTITEIICGFFLVRYFLTNFLLKSKSKQILKSKSHIANLKLRLKTRLKQKNNQLTQSIIHDQTLIEILSPKLSTITSIEFTQPSHYNDLLNELMTINKHLAQHSQLVVNKKSDQQKPQSDKMIIAADVVKDELNLLYQTDRNVVILIAQIYLIQQTIVQKSNELKKVSKFLTFKKVVTEEEVPLEIQNIEEILKLIEKDKLESPDKEDQPPLAA